MTKPIPALRATDPGVWAALAAALLFGAGAPFAKRLLVEVSPWLLAGLLYLGSGLGLALYRALGRAAPVHPTRAEWRWLAGATLAGGVLGPVLLLTGLAALPASSVSLLLNMEGVLTALIAWCVFRENVDRRIALGMGFIVAGGLLLSWPRGGVSSATGWPALAVLGACLAWAIDNNLTRKVALTDASFVAMVKGLVAGTTNLAIALALGAAWPALPTVGAAAVLGFASYGVSLVLFVVALRRLGTARTGAYFSVAPFFGALLAVALLGEALAPALLGAGALMAIGVWLHLAERHEHAHTHEPLEHTHAHTHDAHHRHDHADDDTHDHAHANDDMPARAVHTHAHRHAPLTHRHPHYPDAHHGHRH
jgi:drug/metabolite transporter (DMT)-like permease